MKKKSYIFHNFLLLFSLVIAFIIGKFFYTDQVDYYMNITGKCFINIITLFTFPLILSSVTIGGIGICNKNGDFKKILFSFLFVWLFCSVFAVIVSNISFFAIKSLVNYKKESIEAQNFVSEVSASNNILDIFFPSNIFQALSVNNITGSVLFFFCIGCGIGSIGKSSRYLEFFLDIQMIFLNMVKMIIKFLPILIISLFSKAIHDFSIANLHKTVIYLFSVLSSLVVLAIIFLMIGLFVTGKKYKKFYLGAKDSFIVSFFTSSSLSAFSSNMETLESTIDSNKEDTKRYLPLISTTVMLSTIVDIVSALLFFYIDIEISNVEFIKLCFLSIFLSIGAAGIPSGGLAAIMLCIKMLHLPSNNIYILFVVERLVDMFKSGFNAVFHLSITAFLIKLIKKIELSTIKNSKI